MELREVPHKGDRFLDSVCIELHYFNINEGPAIRKGHGNSRIISLKRVTEGNYHNAPERGGLFCAIKINLRLAKGV